MHICNTCIIYIVRKYDFFRFLCHRVFGSLFLKSGGKKRMGCGQRELTFLRNYNVLTV